jgi:type III restriction enzyme
VEQQFFDQPILNSPYEYPARQWELNEDRQPTGLIVERRRAAEYITPVPKPKKQKAPAQQQRLLLGGPGRSP